MLFSSLVSVLVGALDGVFASPAKPKAGKDLSRVDIHSHFIPPFWREESIKYGYGQPDGMPVIPVSLFRLF